MKVLLVYSDSFQSYSGWEGHFNYGIGYLSSVLKEAGHEISLIHIGRPFLKGEDFLDCVNAFNPRLIAFSSTTLTFKYVCVVAKWLHDPDLRISVISGGIYSTLLPEEILQTPGIDMVCVVEGEVSLKTLFETLKRGKDFKRLTGL